MRLYRNMSHIMLEKIMILHNITNFVAPYNILDGNTTYTNTKVIYIDVEPGAPFGGRGRVCTYTLVISFLTGLCITQRQNS